MNRILLRPTELTTNRTTLTDHRARHIIDTLKATPGDAVRIGILNGSTGTGTVVTTTPDSVTLTCSLDGGIPARPTTDLILALPRPKVMRRLWSSIASLGVRRIFIVNAAEVERNYFDTHWLNPDSYTPLLIEGLEQAGDTHLPDVRIVRQLKPFMEDDAPSLLADSRRVVFHPAGAPAGTLFNTPCRKPFAVAVGPEGGWTDYELAMFSAAEFECITLGSRVLRSDTACIAALTLAQSCQ